MNKSKIEWCNFSWNPVKGLCPEDCKTPDGKSYCYARAMYRRFGWDEKISYDYAPLEAYGKIKSGSRVFVCSTFELFNERVDHFRPSIFSTIESRPDLTFIILTKRPERIDRPMPDNVWLGVSCDGSDWERDDARIEALEQMTTAKVKFISYEPLLGSPRYWGHWTDDRIGGVQWIIAGKLTGRRPKDIGCFKSYNDMVRGHIETLIVLARRDKIPLFLKDNLKDIWGGPLIQEYPK